MLKAEVSKNNSFVQQEIFYTLKLFVGTQISRASLIPPKVVKGDAVFEQMGKEKNYEQMVNGKRYQIYEYKYSIIPQKSGKVVISPAIFQAVKQDRRFNSGIDSIFDDMFTMPSMGGRGKPIQLASEQISLIVEPIPSKFKGENWLPAQSLSIFDEWSKSQGPYPAGEPVTRSITITAEGLATNLLPKIQLQDVPGVKQYATPGIKNEEILDGVKISSLTTEVTVIPTTQGNVTLPEIKIPWWNTKTNKAEVAKLNAVVINIKGGETSKSNTDNSDRGISENNEANIAVADEDQVKDNNVLKDEKNESHKISFIKSRMVNFSSEYYWYIIILLVVAMLGYFAFRKGKMDKVDSGTNDTGKFSGAKNMDQSVEMEKRLIKQIEQSCKNNDAQTTRKNLLLWAKIHWPEESNITLNKLIEQTDDALASEIKLLNEALYQKGDNFWKGEHLASLVKNYLKQKKDQHEQVNQLEPLYKQK
jgi:hypothetical protein